MYSPVETAQLTYKAYTAKHRRRPTRGTTPLDQDKSTRIQRSIGVDPPGVRPIGSRQIDAHTEKHRRRSTRGPTHWIKTSRRPYREETR